MRTWQVANDRDIPKRSMLDALYEKAEIWSKYCKENKDEITPNKIVVSALEMNDWEGNFVICNNESDDPDSIVENFIFALDETYGFQECYQEIDLYLSSLSKSEYDEIEFDDLVWKIVNTAYQSI